MILTTDQADAILESLHAGVSLDRAAKAVRVTVASVRAHAAAEPAWGALLGAAAEACAELNRPAEPAPVAALEAPAKPTAKDEWARLVAASEANGPREERVSPAAKSTRAKSAKAQEDPEIGDSSGTVPQMVDDDGAPDWDQFRDAAARDFGPGPFGLLCLQEERLAARGFPRMGKWWLWTIEDFFASLKRWLLVLAGRGMGKSTVLTRLASLLASFESRRIPPGQLWIWPFVSVRPGDAKKRLSEIQAIYQHAYHLVCKITSPEGTPTMPLLDARGQSIAFVSFASTLGNVSGPNGIGATVDEEEKIERNTSEIIGSLAMTFRARPGIRGIRCSSAMTTRGSLYQSVNEGNTITNFVARIGWRFLPDAVAGFLAVAEWEDARGDSSGGAAIRAYAEGLTADSAAIPTWVGNPSTGSPDGHEWAVTSAAVATRIEVEAVPTEGLDGLPRWRYWLRECGSWATGEDGMLGGDDEFRLATIDSRYGGEYIHERGYE